MLMFGRCWIPWRIVCALVVLVLMTSAVMSSPPSTRAAPAHGAINRSASPAPDAATVWHNIAVQALVAANPPRPNPIPFLDLAVVQVAVHDAVQAIDRRFTPYHVTFPGGASGSSEAAAAKAAHDVLVAILPTQAPALDWAYHNYFPG